jgi:hypothetical protein
MRQYRHAVMVLAMQRAKRAVQADIRAKGLKIAQFTARDITEQAEVYLAQHRDELITKAAADCLTFPEFSRYRAEIDLASVRIVTGNRTLPVEASDNPRTNQQWLMQHQPQQTEHCLVANRTRPTGNANT